MSDRPSFAPPLAGLRTGKAGTGERLPREAPPTAGRSGEGAFPERATLGRARKARGALLGRFPVSEHLPELDLTHCPVLRQERGATEKNPLFVDF